MSNDITLEELEDWFGTLFNESKINYEIIEYDTYIIHLTYKGDKCLSQMSFNKSNDLFMKELINSQSLITKWTNKCSIETNSLLFNNNMKEEYPNPEY